MAPGQSDAVSGFRRLFRLVGVVAVPILVGLALSKRWPRAGENFYATAAQVIATLFVAAAVEFFAREATQAYMTDSIRLLLLIAVSWAGLFACIRALAGGGTRETAGLAGAGVAAVSVLVSLALYEQIKARGEGSDRIELIAAAVITLFLVTPVVILMFL